MFTCTNTAADNGPRCLIAFQLARGLGGVAVTDARFGVDTCSVARTVATAILNRTD